MNPIKIAAAQTPEFREDVEGALAWAVRAAAQARGRGAALLCFPEGFLQGYLTEEGPARRWALDLTSEEFAAVAARFPSDGPVVVLGLIEAEGERLFNTAAVIAGGRLAGRYRKAHLLAGEQAFTPGTEAGVFAAGGLSFGINICNDTNFPQAARKVADTGARLLACPANNMMRYATAEAWKHRHNTVRAERCKETGLWLISADVTGERDRRVGWGPTAVIDPQGEVRAQLPLGEPGLLVFDLPGEDEAA